MAVVLVTGGSSGIGLAIVRRLAAGGNDVFAASRAPTRAALPDGVTPIVLDVEQPDGAETAIGAVVDTSGRLDVLINNAGTGAIGPIEDTSDDDAHHIFEVNVFGPMRLVRAAIPVMRAQGGGRIVNVSSMNDVFTAPFGGWYSASKAALTSASAALDCEVHQFGIRVTVVAPGFFRTEMAEALPEYCGREGSAYRGEMDAVATYNTARLESAGDPDDVARAIEACIAAEDPPARVVVGTDAASLLELLERSSDEEIARMRRDFVAQLGGTGPADRR